MASKEIRAEIERLIQEKREELRALEATLRMITGDKSIAYTDLSRADAERDSDSVDLDALNMPSDEDGPTLMDRVQGVLKLIPENKEFTVPIVQLLLKEKGGYEVPGKHPRSRLAMIMSQLEEQGVVIRTAKPKGFKPHKFKLKSPEDRNFSLVK